MRKVILTSLFMSLLTVSANALEFDASDLKAQFYGQVHMSGFYVSSDAAATDTGIADANFNVKLHDYSRFGANLIFGNFSGVAELQPGSVSTGYFEDSIFRKLFISYNFTNGSKLTLGKDWTPIGYSFDQYADGANGLWGYGTIWEDRQPLIAYEMHGLKVAIIYNQGANDAGSNSSPAYIETDYRTTSDNVQKVPKIEISYSRETDMYDCKLYGAYTRYHNRMEEITTSDTSVLAIDSYIVGFGTKVKFAGAYVSATVFFGENLAPYGLLPYSWLSPTMSSAISVRNIQSGGVSGALGYEFTELVSFNAGGGATFSSDNGFSSANSNTMYSLFFNIPLQVNKFLQVIPEVSYFDNGRNFSEEYQGATVYAGLYFLAEF